MIGEIAPKDQRPPFWVWGPDMAPTVSAQLSRPCSGILALCGCIYIHIIATLNSTTYLCHLAPLLKLLPPPTLPPHPSFPPLIYAHPILMNSAKKSSKTGENHPLSTYLPG